uniref:CCHC-type domain-containing protein n=1 Tax=Leptobrachium leishanense TaxID=445787 RepID=A0A8C5WJH0_9ANUR
MAVYVNYKRDTLRNMLENRGGTPGSKSRDTLIEELQRLDQDAANTALPADTPPVIVATGVDESTLQRKVRERAAYYGAAPTEAVMQHLVREICQEEEREREREHELRLAELRGPRDNGLRGERSPGRKVPFQAFKDFRETDEEIESYLQDFERLCQVHEVHPTDWVRILACKLTGRAAEAYRTVPDEEATNYGHVKQALLSRFAVTPEASRAKFRSSRRPSGATHVEWAHRLQRDLRTWFFGSKAETVPEITQLLLLEQFFEHTPTAIREWVRDRKPHTVQQAAIWADEYVDTRQVTGGERPLLPRPVTPAPSIPAPTVRPLVARLPSRPNTMANIRCYGCNQDGHYKQNCPNRPDLARPSPRPQQSTHCYDADPPWPKPQRNGNDCTRRTRYRRPRPIIAITIARRCGSTGKRRKDSETLGLPSRWSGPT